MINSTHDLKLGSSSAFTLIELSVVLIIIGLIIGGILVGRDLIATAAINAQISQITKYKAAVNAFQDKYNGLPGDLKASQVVVFGFQVVPTRSGTNGLGDGDGLVECYYYINGDMSHDCLQGEMAWFWEDLSSNSGLIEGGFNAAGNGLAAFASNVTIDTLIPAAKLGKSNYVYAYPANNLNYFGLSSVAIDNSGQAALNAGPAAPGLTAVQAYSIDKKIDDGYPQTGTVIAAYINESLSSVSGTGLPQFVDWAAGSSNYGASPGATALPSSTTCYDNGGNASNPMQYTLSISNGRNNNCALSFQFP